MAWQNGWLHWALLSAVFAALTAIFAKVGLEGINPDVATLIRAAIITVLLALFIRVSGQWTDPLSFSARNWTFLVLSALATGASWVCYFRALQIGEAAKVAPVDKLSVLLVGIFAVLFLGERPSLRDWAGLSLVGAGVLLLSLKR